jgi:type IX secretion system PorP/SprF family membrane protein
MFRSSIFFLLIIYCSQLLQAQEPSMYSNYLCNNFYNINPAAAGFDGSFISQITASKKWVGMNGSPADQVFSNSMRLGEEEFYDPNMFLNRPFINLAPRVGLGFTVFNESNGPLRHTGAMFAYAYHLSLRENRLSFGLSGVISQHFLNTQEFKPVNPDASLYSNTSSIIPDVNAGIMFYNRNLFTGISANGLVNLNRAMDHTSTFPDIIVCGGYRIIINNFFKVEPSLFIWKYGQGAFSVDVNGKLYFRDKNWLLLSYLGNGEVLTGIGLNLKTGLQICYTYSINTTGLATYNDGSHSISIRADIATLLRKHK